MPSSRWMLRCVELAEQGRGRTAPNPMVGAVLVGEGGVLAEGWHRAVGGKHAEIEALDALGGRAPGATLYVSLEPCCHHGRTPPCTEAILLSGVRRVVVGALDPDPRMAGKGIEALRRAGLVVEVGVEEERCLALNAAYHRARSAGRPWVTLKAALTLDGRIADTTGASKWITGPQSRALGHHLRHTHDAVAVGSGTLLADDPRLTARVEGGRDPLPVILDTALRCPERAAVLAAGRRPVIYAGFDAPQRALPADVVRVPASAGGLDLRAVLADLGQRGVASMLVEGGGRVHRSLLDADLVDSVHLFVAPIVLAGGAGWVGGEPFSLARAPSFRVVAQDRTGDDVHLVLERR